MINAVWLIIFSLSLLFAAIGGSFSAVSDAVFRGGSKAVELAITLTGIVCFWSGIMEAARQSGVTEAVSVLLRPLTRTLFPSLKKGSKALEYIVMNITANLLGLGNAATPFGIMAIKELDRENNYLPYASDAMCMFVVINTAAPQLLPTTIIGLRSAAGAAAPYEITVPIWITSLCSLTAGIICARIMEKSRTFSRGGKG